MKAKVLKDFIDKYTGKRHNAGDVISVSKERFEEILTVGELVEAIEETAEPEKADAEKPKKTTKKATKKSAE